MESIDEIVRLLVNLSDLWAKKKMAFVLKHFPITKSLCPWVDSLPPWRVLIAGLEGFKPTCYSFEPGLADRTPSRGWIAL
jgi:hypothetical protein